MTRRERRQRARRREETGERQTGPWPCDSADLTGLGLSAAVPLAFVRIAGENSIPVRAAIFSPNPGRSETSESHNTLRSPLFAILMPVQLPCVPGTRKPALGHSEKEKKKKKEGENTQCNSLRPRTLAHAHSRGCAAEWTPWGGKLLFL